MTTADSVLDEVLSERLRQINRYGYDAAHDDGHLRGEIGRAALNYAAAAVDELTTDLPPFAGARPPFSYGLGLAIAWPFELAAWKPAAPRAMLIKAMALLCAEVERIDRAEARRG